MVYHHEMHSQKEYLVRANNRVIHCRPYEEIALRVPVEPAEKPYNSYWERLWNCIDEDPDREVHYRKITVLCTKDVQDENKLFFVTEKDKAIMQAAMECGASCVNNNLLKVTNYRRACYKLFTENRYHDYYYSHYDVFDEEEFTDEFKVLYGCFKRRSYLIAVKSLSDIQKQFTDQDLKEEQKKQAEKLKQEEKIGYQRADRELLRQRLLQQIQESKKRHASKIIEEFYRLNLLSKPTLTNDEKIKEYAAVREFCINHMPVLDDKTFDLGILPTDYPDYINKTCFDTFISNWRNVNRSYKTLVRGARGEAKVLEVLRLYDDRIHILPGYTWDCEHDFVVISPFGIFTVEVKNLWGEYVITETGWLKPISNQTTKPKDVALQSKRHIETLRRNLRNCGAFSDDIPMFEIICSAEPSFSITDEYGYIPVCNYNTLDKILLPLGGKVVLSEEQMLEIKNYLVEHWMPPFTFPCGDFDSRDSFIRTFADIASGFYVAHHSLPTECVRDKNLVHT